MPIYCLQAHELNRCHGLLSAAHFRIAKSKTLWSLVCPPRTWSIWSLSHRLPSPSVLFVASPMAAARNTGPRKVYTNKGHAVGAVCGVYFLCLLSQLEHLLWSVLYPSHPHKHCLTLVESAPLCWLNMSLLQAFTWWFFFLLEQFFNSHFAMCSIEQYHWVILCFQWKCTSSFSPHTEWSKWEGIPLQLGLETL